MYYGCMIMFSNDSILMTRIRCGFVANMKIKIYNEILYYFLCDVLFFSTTVQIR